MKKKFIVLFLIVVCINNIFSKEILKGSGKLESKHSYSSVSLNDPNYSFCVSTSNEKSVVVNELTFVTEEYKNTDYPEIYNFFNHMEEKNYKTKIDGYNCNQGL